MPVLYGNKWGTEINNDYEQKKLEAKAKEENNKKVMNALVGAAAAYLTAGLTSGSMALSQTTGLAAVKGGLEGAKSTTTGQAAIAGGITGAEKGLTAEADAEKLKLEREKLANESLNIKNEAAKLAWETGTPAEIKKITTPAITKVTPATPIERQKYGIQSTGIGLKETPGNLQYTPSSVRDEVITPAVKGSLQIEKERQDAI